MTSISIVIVNYNSGALLAKCISSICENITLDYEVVVVDNNSTDNSIALCSTFWTVHNVRLIQLENNLGFSKANNIGANASLGRFIHFLNPDTEVSVSLNDDYLYLISGVATRCVYINTLINKDGSIENSRNLILTIDNLFYKVFRSKSVKYWYKGATLIISKEAYSEIQGWDEDYFMYSEDLDIFYRLQKKGYDIVCLQSRIFHLGGGCTSNVWTNQERLNKVKTSFKLFYTKNRTLAEYYLIRTIMFILNKRN